jgi:hypothetical protein
MVPSNKNNHTGGLAEAGHSYTGVTVARHSFAPMGNIDSEQDHTQVYKNIKATDNAFAPMGNWKVRVWTSC